MRALLAALTLTASSAWATDVAANVGVFELVLVPPTHGGFYPYVGASVTVPTHGANLTAALSLEVSFDQGRGGLVANFVADFPVSDHLGLDLNFTVVHDQPGLRFDEALFFVGLGPGATWVAGKWAVSLAASVYVGLTAPGFAFGPTLNVARAF